MSYLILLRRRGLMWASCLWSSPVFQLYIQSIYRTHTPVDQSFYLCPVHPVCSHTTHMMCGLVRAERVASQHYPELPSLSCLYPPVFITWHKVVTMTPLSGDWIVAVWHPILLAWFSVSRLLRLCPPAEHDDYPESFLFPQGDTLFPLCVWMARGREPQCPPPTCEQLRAKSWGVAAFMVRALSLTLSPDRESKANDLWSSLLLRENDWKGGLVTQSQMTGCVWGVCVCASNTKRCLLWQSRVPVFKWISREKTNKRRSELLLFLISLKSTTKDFNDQC